MHGIEQLLAEVEEFWPCAAAAAQGLAELGRGECQDLASAFADIAGVSRDQWLRHVESHKQARAS